MTAVEWLAEEIIMLEEKLRLEEININDFMDAKDELVSKALEMEKKIIAQAFEDGDYNYFYNHENGKEFENGIEYYNKKFKSE